MRAFLIAALGVWPMVLVLASSSQFTLFDLHGSNKKSLRSGDRTDRKSGRLEKPERFAFRDEGRASPRVRTGRYKKVNSEDETECEESTNDVMVDRDEEIWTSYPNPWYLVESMLWSEVKVLLDRKENEGILRFEPAQTFIDIRLGPPSAKTGDDLSRLVIEEVPFGSIPKLVKNLNKGFVHRDILWLAHGQGLSTR